MDRDINRRKFLGVGLGATAGLMGASLLHSAVKAQGNDPYSGSHAEHSGVQHGSQMLVGKVDHVRNGFDPMQMLVDWDYGKVSTQNGRTVREYEFSAGEHEIEIAPGIFFPA